MCNAVTCLPEYTASHAQRRVTFKDECTLHSKAGVKGVGNLGMIFAVIAVGLLGRYRASGLGTR